MSDGRRPHRFPLSARDVRAGLEGLRALLECPHLYDDLGCVWCEGPLEVAA